MGYRDDYEDRFQQMADDEHLAAEKQGLRIRYRASLAQQVARQDRATSRSTPEIERASALNSVGLALGEEGKFQRALEKLSAAAALDPESGVIRDNQAIIANNYVIAVLVPEGDFTEAVDLLAPFVGSESITNGSLNHSLALSLRFTGLTDEGIEQAKKAIRYDRHRAVYRMELYRGYIQKNNEDPQGGEHLVYAAEQLGNLYRGADKQKKDDPQATSRGDVITEFSYLLAYAMALKDPALIVHRIIPALGFGPRTGGYLGFISQTLWAIRGIETMAKGSVDSSTQETIDGIREALDYREGTLHYHYDRASDYINRLKEPNHDDQLQAGIHLIKANRLLDFQDEDTNNLMGGLIMRFRTTFDNPAEDFVPFIADHVMVALGESPEKIREFADETEALLKKLFPKGEVPWDIAEKFSNMSLGQLEDLLHRAKLKKDPS